MDWRTISMHGESQGKWMGTICSHRKANVGYAYDVPKLLKNLSLVKIFRKKYDNWKNIYNFVAFKPAPLGGRADKHWWNPEADDAVCRAWPRGKDVFGRYLSVVSQTSQIWIHITAVMRRSVCVGDLIFKIYHSAWAGLRCLSLIWRQCEGPRTRDRRGGINSHVFFVSRNFNLIY